MSKNKHVKHDFFEKLNMDEKNLKLQVLLERSIQKSLVNKSKIIVIS
jgi:hypothetical protein